MNNKGFIATSLIYSFFLIFITLFLTIIADYLQNKVLLNRYDKGVSTKGKGRGNGLYFAKKLIGKNKNMSSENILLNGYYIQKLLINIVEQ